MNLKNLTDAELNNKMLALVQREREILHEVILHIVEVDRRQLYLNFGFESLFEYMTCHLKYSNGSAQRRIDAARLSVFVPAVVEKIQSGDLTLTQASLVQRSLRELKKETKKVLSVEEKHDLVDLVLNHSEKETQSLLAKTLDLPVIEQTKIKLQADDSVRLEITLTKEQWENLEKAKALLSHAVPDGSLSDIIHHMSQKVIKHFEGKEQKAKRSDKSKRPHKDTPKKMDAETSRIENSISTVLENKTQPTKTISSTTDRKSISLTVKRFLLNKANHQCQHVNAISRHRCRSKWQLEVDHKQPVWAGGTNDPDNLQILCRRHNQRKYLVQTYTKRLQ